MPLEFAKRKALLEVMGLMFSSVEDLRTFLKDSLGRNADDYAVGKLPAVRSGIIDAADEREWLAELIEALKEVAGPDARTKLEGIDVRGHFSKSRVAAFRTAVPDLQHRLGIPEAASEAAVEAAVAARLPQIAAALRGEGNVSPELRRALENLGLLAETPAGPVLEKLVHDSNSLLDIHNWVTRLVEIEGNVCRIAIEASGNLFAKGTGFLVAPDVVLTNYHVIAPVLRGDYQPKQLRAQFDYHVLRDGRVDAGTIVALEEQWCIASASHDPLDTRVHDLAEDPQPGMLDFALLRLAHSVGCEPIGGNGTNLPPRGWLDLERTAPNAAAGDPVFIVQHPSGGPMKLALDTAGVIGYSPEQRRIRYRTNTLSGSSGSPVFNQNWELLALHHAGDPKYPDLDTGQYNEGIPIRTLARFLVDNDLMEKLKRPDPCS